MGVGLRELGNDSRWNLFHHLLDLTRYKRHTFFSLQNGVQSLIERVAIRIRAYTRIPKVAGACFWILISKRGMQRVEVSPTDQVRNSSSGEAPSLAVHCWPVSLRTSVGLAHELALLGIAVPAGARIIINPRRSIDPDLPAFR